MNPETFSRDETVSAVSMLPPRRPPSTLIRVCCSCRAHLAGPILPRSLVERPPAWLAVSHGLCRDCADRIVAAYQAQPRTPVRPIA